MSEFNYYVDGAATMRKDNNGNYIRGAGGWSFIFIQDNQPIEIQYGGAPKTTNQEMELYSILAALRHFCSMGCHNTVIEIYSDSAYSINIYTKWIKNWEKNNWTRSKGEPIINLSIIKETWRLIKEIQNHFKTKIVWTKVKGHNNIKYNEMADEYAVKGKKESEKNNLIVDYKNDGFLKH